MSKFLSASFPCMRDADNWRACQLNAQSESFGLHNANNMYLPVNSMWTHGNHYNSNCLSIGEYNQMRQYGQRFGLPQPKVFDTYDAYQNDFWSIGTRYVGTEVVS